MLAAFLAFKRFFREERSIYVLLKMDNMSATAYINDGRGGGGSVSNFELTEQRVLAMVHGERHNSASPTPGWSPKLHCGYRIQRQIRLDALPKHIPDNQLHAGTTGSGLVRLQTHSSAPLLCELETRSGGYSNGCLHHNLDYDSQFQKWIGWFSSQGADLLSCPVGKK